MVSFQIYINFPEFTHRPDENLGEEMLASTGIKLSGLLFKLKNGGIKKER